MVVSGGPRGTIGGDTAATKTQFSQYSEKSAERLQTKQIIKRLSTAK